MSLRGVGRRGLTRRHPVSFTTPVRDPGGAEHDELRGDALIVRRAPRPVYIALVPK